MESAISKLINLIEQACKLGLRLAQAGNTIDIGDAVLELESIDGLTDCLSMCFECLRNDRGGGECRSVPKYGIEMV